MRVPVGELRNGSRTTGRELRREPSDHAERVPTRVFVCPSRPGRVPSRPGREGQVRLGPRDRQQPVARGECGWSFRKCRQWTRSPPHIAEPSSVRSCQQQLSSRNRPDAGQRHCRHRAAIAASHLGCGRQPTDRAGLQPLGRRQSDWLGNFARHGWRTRRTARRSRFW